MVKQVDTRDLKSLDLGHPGSIPGGRTKISSIYADLSPVSFWSVGADFVVGQLVLTLWLVSTDFGNGQSVLTLVVVSVRTLPRWGRSVSPDFDPGAPD